MELLATENHLLACDMGLTTDYAEPSAVLDFDLKDGAELGRHEFPAGAQFCNDLTTDEQGNVYVSESFANGLYSARESSRQSLPALTCPPHLPLNLTGTFGWSTVSWTTSPLAPHPVYLLHFSE